jgi:SAM-dependent methyltransferase
VALNCRFCGARVSRSVVDLGSAPPSNAYLRTQALRSAELWFPLRVVVCEECWLVQLDEFDGDAGLFPPDYAYFSGYSTTWLKHCEKFVEDVVKRFNLTESSQVVEIASNDGTLLQYVANRGVSCYGVEPTAITAAAARDRGIEVIERFFGEQAAHELVDNRGKADLIVANNVIAHVPDINDFVAGFRVLLKDGGVAVFEFPHLLRLVAGKQYDTIYHEHFFYLSFTVVHNILSRNGLVIFDVEELPTHGGSLRVFAKHRENKEQDVAEAVMEMLQREAEVCVCDGAFYDGLQSDLDAVKNDLLAFLVESRRESKSVVGYGAAAKGNTLLNYAGVKADLVSYVVDSNPAKQGRWMPGSRIPIVSEGELRKTRPEFVLILPWNLRDEIVKDTHYIQEWGGKHVTAVPKLVVS